MSIWGKSIKGKVKRKGKDPEVKAALKNGNWKETSVV